MLLYVDGNCHVVLGDFVESGIWRFQFDWINDPGLHDIPCRYFSKYMLHFLLAVETLLNLLKEKSYKKHIIHLIMLMARIHATYCVKDKAKKRQQQHKQIVKIKCYTNSHKLHSVFLFFSSKFYEPFHMSLVFFSLTRSEILNKKCLCIFDGIKDR